jgi:ADP-heptose:LPS heptosyltransferase
MRLWFAKGAWASNSARKRILAIEPEQVGSIAIIRHAALGDMVLTRPFIIECRRLFPNAKITLSLVSNYTRGAPEDLVDRIHVMYGRDLRDISVGARLKKIRELGYHDLIFDAAATSRSLWVVKLNRAKIKVGFPYRISHRHLFYDVAILRSAMRYEAEAMLDMLHVFGFKTKYPLVFKLPGVPLMRERPCIIYFTSASMPEKCWPIENFIELIKQASTKFKAYDHIVLKGVTESESIKEIMATIKSDNVISCETDTVEETISLIKGAKAVVSNDTGIRHLAVAADVPTVGIFLQSEKHYSEPYRYWLRYPIHEAAFREDGMAPESGEVLRLLRNVLQIAGGS